MPRLLINRLDSCVLPHSPMGPTALPSTFAWLPRDHTTCLTGFPQARQPLASFPTPKETKHSSYSESSTQPKAKATGPRYSMMLDAFCVHPLPLRVRAPPFPRFSDALHDSLALYAYPPVSWPTCEHSLTSLCTPHTALPVIRIRERSARTAPSVRALGLSTAPI